MKQQILISALILLSIAGFAGAVNLPGLGFYGSSEDDFTAYKEGELIVRFADVDGVSQLLEGPVIMGPLTTQAVRNSITDFLFAGAEVHREYDEIAPGLVVVTLPEGTSVMDAFIRFNRSANVLYAEPNYKYKLLAVPNDPMFSEMWGLDNTGQSGGTEDADVDAPEAWDVQTGDPEIVIAITDSGVDYTHPDLVHNMWVNTAELNGTPDVDDDNNGYVDDIYGYDFAGAVANDPSDDDSDPDDCFFHGTHVAGTIGAVANNNKGIVGVCWNVKMMALKVFADDYHVEPEVFASEAVEAIRYAIDNGARIINASWGGDFYSQSLYDVIKDAGDAGLLFVAAAGNDYGSDNDANPVYPASFDLDNIISVMSTDHDDRMSDFSNYGATSVDVAEPGSEVLSTTPTNQTFAMLVFGVSTDYALLSGTSMAAPHVSGACTLIWSEYPTLAHKTVKGILLKTVDPVLGSQFCLSGGRINLHSALTLIPSGKAGKVLNSKDDPGDTANLYSTIQEAIDDANDGDVLIAEANALFLEVIDFKGKAITLRSGDISNPDDPNISPEDTIILGILDDDSVVKFQNGEGPDTVLKGFTISWGSADYGGGIRCDGTSPRITDCIISNNFASYYGAGIDCVDGSPVIENCTIIDNQTSSNTGIGGGVNCERSSPTITNCLISNNFADNVGGGIACYYSDPTIFNCVVANNSAVYQGGGIDLEYSSPTITSCTVVVDDPNAPKNGGISAFHGSSPVVTNCILWGNGDDLYKCSATYSCIEDDDGGVGNIHSEPLFMTGPLGDYYLKQTAAGQLSDSPCVDAGNPDTDISLIDTYTTTRTDGVIDEGVIDIGVHYPALPARLVQLDVIVVDANVPVDPNLANGYVEPGSGLYRQYEVVQLTAYPDAGYRIKAWTGTDDDSSTEHNNIVTVVADADITIEFEQVPLYQLRTEVIGGRGAVLPSHKRGEYYPEGMAVALVAAPDQTYIVDRWVGTDDDTSWSRTNTVTMGSDKDVTVQFRQPKSLHVPGQYQNIRSAIDAAYDHGDKIIVSSGTYGGGYDFMGKAITIASEHPDDPCCVAETIIEIWGGPAFIFQSGEGSESVVDGFTIIGGGDFGHIALLDGVGTHGEDALGGAITCLNGSSPTLSHLVIRDCVARGGDGENNVFIFDPPSDPDDAEEGLEPLEPLPDPDVPDPSNPSMWYPEDPNGPELPGDPNAPIDGFAGEAGEDGLPGEPGMDGLDGMPGWPGGNAGVGYGGAMYFDADSSPTILYCTIIDCMAIGGDGGSGGVGQDGQGGQGGQPGQEGQGGQAGGEGLNDGAQGSGGNGGNGSDGGRGGNGGRGGDGGKGGDGAEALGGAIYFGPNCRPTIKYCKILNCTTRQGLGNYGGDGGNGGSGGVGAEGADGGSGGGGEPDGEDGEAGADSPGGGGGDGGNGGNMGINGTKSWAGAIYYGENCEVEISDTIISYNTTTTIVPTYTYGGGDGGNGGLGGDGEGEAAGGDGGNGGNGGAGGPPPRIVPEDDAADAQQPAAQADDPNDAPNIGPGDGGVAGDGGSGGEAGEDGLVGPSSTSFTSNYGGANYYELGCKVKITDCTISYNSSREYDGSGQDGGGEDYKEGCEVILNRCELIGNTAGSSGNGGAQCFDGSCLVEINDCNYVNNSAGDDGGGLFTLSDCLLDINNSRFISNSTLGHHGCGGAVYGGGVWERDTGEWYNGGKVEVSNSYFASNEAAFGGGLYWYGDEADISIAGSVISNNTAEHGGGMYWSNGAPVIADCSIMGNRAKARWFMPYNIVYQEFFSYEKPSGGGGGMFCWSSDAKIENCFIIGNSSASSGGGVYFGGAPNMPILNNCLVKGNSAVLDGGGIVSYWLTAPTISNCTIVDNRAYDPDSSKHGRGGGLSCSYESQTTLIDSILWGNTGTHGNQIVIGSDSEPFYIDRPATLTVSYCDIQGGRSPESIYTEPGRILNWLDGNIDADPLFVESHYSLSQTTAGQSADSPCVDTGSGLAVALGLDGYTTRTDGLGDTGTVDMGLHYPIGEGKYRLIVNVVGEHGTVKPSGGLFDRYTVVTLVTTVDTGYGVKWIGTDNDGSDAFTNTVTMDSNKTVTVEFAQSVGRTVTVPGNYPTIQEAVSNAKDGDAIVIEPGIYYGGYRGVSLVVDKSVLITSRNPDDPRCVAATIIDGYMGIHEDTHFGVIFTSNTDSGTVLNGITIQNCGGEWANGDDGDRDVNHPNGGDGGCEEGAAIYIQNEAGPIIKNCIIRGNLARGGDGGDGVDAEGDDPILNAGRGGWSGWAHGGGIYCGPDSSPTFINCTIESNVARGGDAGDGGDGGGASEGYANYGGNWSRSQATHYDPDSSLIEYVIGDLWKVWEWDLAFYYGNIYSEPNLTSYFGDYRWYSGYGGGAFCDIGSNVTFVNCEIRGNRTYGGMSGIGGEVSGSNRILDPVLSYEIPTYGAGVYCAADSVVTFTDCTFEDNIASGLPAGVTDPNHRLDPYIGYGGGVCAENSAAVVFVDCNFVDNEADSGGGMYIDSTDVTIIDCNVASNTALRGGGLLGVDSSIDIMSSEITNNWAVSDVNDPNTNGVLAAGAGLYCWLGGVNIQDCNISDNRADFSGGGVYLRDVNNALFVNSLIINNAAGRDGGGVSANWFTTSVISNCTFVGNATTGNFGDPNETGFGGGLFCSYESDCVVTDSIFWNNYNYALKGDEIAVGSGFEFDTRPTTLTITHSGIKDGRSAVWVDDSCTLNWGAGNIDDDPLFTAGLLGGYYLSQTDAGQSRNSPYVDAGSDYASNVGLIGYTTHTDEIADTGMVDIGYHYPMVEPCRLCDLVYDGIINFRDFAIVADRWLEDGCSQANMWCQGADLTSDTSVDMEDIALLTNCWLVEDNVPPVPDPSRWETEPYLSGSSIRMTAETATDGWGWDVEYYFDCIDSDDSHDSGWQKSPTYTDTGLTSGVEYAYRVKTRDELGNETEWSQIRYAGRDSTPPAPAPYMETIDVNSPTSISMTATLAYDDSGVEYYFENTSGDGHDSGWQDDPNYTDVGLDPNTEYSYRVKARDKSSDRNETSWSDTVSVTIPVPADMIAPTPDPMLWDPVDDPNGFDGTPREIYGGGGSWDYWAEMRAVEATDASGLVEYFFECTTEPGFSSGWITFPTGQIPTYTVLVGRSGQGHHFRVRARDMYHNETAWSTEERAD